MRFPSSRLWLSFGFGANILACRLRHFGGTQRRLVAVFLWWLVFVFISLSVHHLLIFDVYHIMMFLGEVALKRGGFALFHERLWGNIFTESEPQSAVDFVAFYSK